MDIIQAAEEIKQLYRANDNNEEKWKRVIVCFNTCMSRTDDLQMLEKCILDDENWELSTAERLALLEKAKMLGASSTKFLLDYYGYLAAHLDPGPTQEQASRQMDSLML